MPYAKIENNEVIYPPKNDGNHFNVDKNPQWLAEHGFSMMSDEELSQYAVTDEIDTTAFQNACAQFKSVCRQIGEAIGVSNFTGGFDEYATFINSDYAKENPAQASLLASMWSGANEYAKYEGAKIGLGQPEWWYRCWEQEEL